MQLHWLAIPKGVVTRTRSGQPGRHLRITVMPVIDQAALIASGEALPNWPQRILDELLHIEVQVDTLKQTIAFDRAYLRPDVWEKIFAGRKGRGTGSKNARQLSHIANPTSEYSKAATHAMAALIAMRLHQQEAERSPVAIRGVPLTQLFTSQHSGTDAKLARGTTWADDVRKGYSQMGELFLPPKPPFAELRAAMSDAVKARADNDIVAALQRLYTSKVAVQKDRDAPPVFSATGMWSLSKEAEALDLKRRNAMAMGGFDHPWARAAVRQMVSTVAYVPQGDNPTETVAKATREYQTSEQNAMAALLAEAGLLGTLGLLFDVEIPIHDISLEGKAVSAQGVWRTQPVPLPLVYSTATNAAGTPRSRSELFAEIGFMRLGKFADDGSPEFMLTDFRFDEAIHSLQNSAQADRNSLPEYSPAMREDLVPSHQFNQMHSHELTLHWRARPSHAAGGRQPTTPGTLHLEDLVIGVRPIVGEISSAGRVRWSDVSAKKAEFGVLSGVVRSQEDRMRDAAMAPLVTFDKRTERTSSVSEVLVAWNGWGFGVALPDQPDARVLKKSETPAEKLPRFRYGKQVCMAAKLVLRDGSSLIQSNQLDASLGQDWNHVNASLVVAARSGGETVPFRLLRWERLGAPTVLHDGRPPTAGWWPTETASRVVVATAYNSHAKSRHESSRVVVPAQMSNMHATWQHGVFDDPEVHSPHVSAYVENDRDPETGGFARAVSEDGRSGREQVFRQREMSASHSMPYHPDPLVTRFRVWAIRRIHEGTSDGLFLGSDGKPVQALFHLYGKRGSWPNARALRLRVIAVDRSARKLFSLDESSDTLEVRMPMGEKLTLVMVPEGDDRRLATEHAMGSTRVQEMLARFPEVARAYESMRGGDRGLIDQPYLAAPVHVEVQHALDRPYAQPLLTDLKLLRQVEQSVVDLGAKAAYDVGSTAAIEIHVVEERIENNLDRVAEAYRRTGNLPPVQRSSLLVRSFNKAEIEMPLDQSALQPPIRPAAQVKLNCLHDFHDFQHHRVSYWLRALRDIEKDPQGEVGNPAIKEGNAVAFESLHDQARVVHVLASRRPSPPSVRYMIPAFRFHTARERNSIRRTRHGELALHLDGVWPDSGPDEKLVVVLLSSTSSSGYDDDRNRFDSYVSFWGSDPVKQGPQTTARMPDLIAPGHVGCTAPIRYRLPVDGSRAAIDVQLIPFEPQFCADAKSWRVEIPVRNPSAVSRPFLRIAVARYQPFALTDALKLSAITLVDYLQLPDDRELVITRDPHEKRTLHVMLIGVSHEATSSLSVANLSCRLEERCTRQEGGLASWETLATSQSWERTVREGRACWCTTLRAPESVDCGKYRLGVIEEETYLLEADPNGVRQSGMPVYFDFVPLGDLR